MRQSRVAGHRRPSPNRPRSRARPQKALVSSSSCPRAPLTKNAPCSQHQTVHQLRYALYVLLTWRRQWEQVGFRPVLRRIQQAFPWVTASRSRSAYTRPAMAAPVDLPRLRESIEEVDREILKRLKQRMELVEGVARAKLA